MLSSPKMKTTAPTRQATADDAISEGGTFAALCDPQTYLDAFNHCRKDAIWKASVQYFERDKLKFCIALANAVKNGTFTPEDYKEFDIFERGKKRHIKAPPIKDRVFTHALCNAVLAPAVMPRMIYDNSAAIKHRGVSFARKRILVHLRRFYKQHGSEGYILQIDFSKFFESIDHALLYQAFCKYITDPRIRHIIKIIIDSFGGDRGLGIGSELSQIAGIIYPSPIDHFCKTVRRCKFYGRYMDDIYIIHHDKDFLKDLLADIQILTVGLKLSLNPRKCHLNKLSRGFAYLKTNYRLTESGRVLYKPAATTLRRERHRLRNMMRRHRAGKLSLDDIKDGYRSWRGNIRRQYPQVAAQILTTFDKLFSQLYGDCK